MKPLYGSSNDKGEWFDGKDWRKWNEKHPERDIFRQMETLRQHDENNCHVDGCFSCPRCRRQHFVPDNYEFLCDGCVWIIQAHPMATTDQLSGIAEWRAKARVGVSDPDVSARYALRAALIEQQETRHAE